MMSGTMGPRILVSKEITKKVRKTKLTVQRLLAMTCLFTAVPSNCVTLSPRIAACPCNAGDRSCKGPPRGRKSRPPSDSLAESVVPDPRRTYEISVLSERRQCQFCLFKRNESATLANHVANAVKEKGRTLHHAAAQDDHVRHKKIDQIGQTETEVVGLALHRPASQLIPLLRKQADLFGREIRGMAVVRWRIHFEPLN